MARDYLDQALNHVSDGVAIFDADDCLVACNENYKSLYGNRLGVVMPGATFDALVRSSAALQLEPNADIGADADIERSVRDFKERIVTEFQTIDGRTIEAGAHPLSGGGTAHICIDITRRRHAEESREHGEMLRGHAERIAHLGSWEIDYGDGQVKWSDEVYRPPFPR